MRPSIVLLEFDSIAVGIRAGDAMAKRAPLLSLHAGTVHPGKYLILAGGEVADVEEAKAAGREAAAAALVDEIFLPDVHEDVVGALTGARRPGLGEALGIIETRTVAPIIGAADAAVKGAEVRLLEIHLADGLGGKAYALFSGLVGDVQSGVAAGVASLQGPDQLVAEVVIPQLHEEMMSNLEAHPDFGSRTRTWRAEG